LLAWGDTLPRSESLDSIARRGEPSPQPSKVAVGNLEAREHDARSFPDVNRGDELEDAVYCGPRVFAPNDARNIVFVH
jgi:hypothetical protein